MRGNSHAGMAPKGIILGERLDSKNIERRVRKMAAIERSKQIIVTKASPAADIDDACTFRKTSEDVVRQEVACVGGQRQNRDEDVRFR